MVQLVFIGGFNTRGVVMSQYYNTCTWAKGYMIGAYRADTSMISAYRADACGS